MNPHWLDDIITLVRREGERWAQGNPDKAAHHETAAALLTQLRDTGVSHAEANDNYVDRGVAALKPRDNVLSASPYGPPPFAG